MFPVSNCTLLKIEQPGTLTAYGKPGAFTAVWEGRVPGYLKRTRRAALTAGRGGGYAERVQTIVKTDVLWLLASDGAPVVEEAGPDWEGSQLTVLDERGTTPVEATYLVAGMENRVGHTAVDNLRLELASPAGGASNG